MYNDDIIWDDVKDSKTLETLLPELQKKGVTNYDITLVIFENQNKMQAFFKETEIKGI